MLRLYVYHSWATMIINNGRQRLLLTIIYLNTQQWDESLCFLNIPLAGLILSNSLFPVMQATISDKSNVDITIY